MQITGLWSRPCLRCPSN